MDEDGIIPGDGIGLKLRRSTSQIYPFLSRFHPLSFPLHQNWVGDHPFHNLVIKITFIFKSHIGLKKDMRLRHFCQIACTNQKRLIQTFEKLCKFNNVFLKQKIIIPVADEDQIKSLLIWLKCSYIKLEIKRLCIQQCIWRGKLQV